MFVGIWSMYINVYEFCWPMCIVYWFRATGGYICGCGWPSNLVFRKFCFQIWTLKVSAGVISYYSAVFGIIWVYSPCCFPFRNPVAWICSDDWSFCVGRRWNMSCSLNVLIAVITRPSHVECFYSLQRYPGSLSRTVRWVMAHDL